MDGTGQGAGARWEPRLELAAVELADPLGPCSVFKLTLNVATQGLPSKTPVTRPSWQEAPGRGGMQRPGGLGGGLTGRLLSSGALILGQHRPCRNLTPGHTSSPQGQKGPESPPLIGSAIFMFKSA